MRNYIRWLYRLLWPLLYRRSEYKLFLRITLGDIDLGLQRLASLSDYFSGTVRSIPIEAPFGKSMLVVAPHQDDEIIGCGGALALQVQSGHRAHILLIQDGAGGCEELGMTRAQLSGLRNEESRRAAALLGIEPVALNHPELPPASDQIIRQMVDLLLQTKTDVVFTPFLFDGNPEHRQTSLLLAEALKQVSWPVRVMGYEVWGLCIPNVIVNIDAVIEKKLEMLRCFEFANQALDYVNTTKGLNMYRSRLFNAGRCSHAECFFEVPREEFIALMEKVQAAERSARPAVIPPA